jgi:hypothetical protein
MQVGEMMDGQGWVMLLTELMDDLYYCGHAGYGRRAGWMMLMKELMDGLKYCRYTRRGRVHGWSRMGDAGERVDGWLILLPVCRT